MLTIRHGDDNGTSFYANVVTFGFNNKTRRGSFIQLIDDERHSRTIDKGAVAVFEHGREIASYVADAEPQENDDLVGLEEGDGPRPHPHLTAVPGDGRL